MHAEVGHKFVGETSSARSSPTPGRVETNFFAASGGGVVDAVRAQIEDVLASMASASLMQKRGRPC